LADKDEHRVLLACGLNATQLPPGGQLCDVQHKDLLPDDTQTSYGLEADSYHELIDYPFEIAEQDRIDFIVHDDKHQTLPHSF